MTTEQLLPTIQAALAAQNQVDSNLTSAITALLNVIRDQHNELHDMIVEMATQVDEIEGRLRYVESQTRGAG